jgi:hypothetical protein
LAVALKPGRDTHRPPRSRRRERVLGLIALAAAGVVPAIVYRDLLSQVVGSFGLDVGYIVFGASGFALMALGLLASFPVVFSIGRNPDSRLYPRSRGALAGWGVSLYLMGITLVVQIGAIAQRW